MTNKLDKTMVGYRVELHPSTDLWMFGMRYGTIISAGRTKYTVELDNHRRVRIHPHQLYAVILHDGKVPFDVYAIS